MEPTKTSTEVPRKISNKLLSLFFFFLFSFFFPLLTSVPITTKLQSDDDLFANGTNFLVTDESFWGCDIPEFIKHFIGVHGGQSIQHYIRYS